MYSLDLPCFFIPHVQDKVLLFPNFQRSFGRLLPPVFLTECKGKGRTITTKIYFELFSNFWM